MYDPLTDLYTCRLVVYKCRKNVLLLRTQHKRITVCVNYFVIFFVIECLLVSYHSVTRKILKISFVVSSYSSRIKIINVFDYWCLKITGIIEMTVHNNQFIFLVFKRDTDILLQILQQNNFSKMSMNQNSISKQWWLISIKCW